MTEKLKLTPYEEQLKELPKVDAKSLKDPVHPIVFDTNFLFITFDYSVDVIDQLQGQLGTDLSFYICQGTLRELRDMKSAKKRSQRDFLLVLTFLKKYDFKVIKSQENYVDKHLADLGKKYSLYIATSDRGVKRSLRDTDSKIVFMRQKNYLEIE